MEVLNPQPALCLPQAMWLVYRTVMTKPDLSQVEVLDMVTPVSMRDASPQQGAHARRALNALREFGLVQVEADLLQAVKVKSASEFLRILRRKLIVPPGEQGPDFDGAPDLRSALVWLMRQSPKVPLHYADNVQTNMPAGLFTNDTRWNGFRWWSEALGFGQRALRMLATDGGDTKTKIIANPTVAVVDAIQNPFGDPLPRDERIPIERFLEFLRLELPVLPGHPSATYPGLVDDDDRAIAALGLALSTAEQLKVLTMGYQSDPSGVLALPEAHNYRESRYVSNITIKRRQR